MTNASRRIQAPRHVRVAAVSLILATSLMGTGTLALASEGDANAILKSMTDYVGSQTTIELSFDSGIEVITPELEKIQFTNSGGVLLSRPDKLRAHRVGGYAGSVVPAVDYLRALRIRRKLSQALDDLLSQSAHFAALNQPLAD